ncbi:hypothetical protein OUZ56_000067 [Daphnia magna]|uniref:Peptidase S1 domain-containing protein n=1 Tax=Daphnia magna TaxID=35525 RepID=A0ABQ9ZZA0_9CRUS|nr:hypothetical protein OUZ56_000067 [Daphnia magna]
MGHHQFNLPFLLIGLICVTPTLSLSLRRAVEEKIPEQEIVADMLELARAADVKVACPLSDTFCLPRVKCPIKSIVYDREGTRFMVGAEFRDIFGCGAFSPTWTYVCCATLDKLEEEGWRPTPDLWFLPSHDGSPPAKDVDASAPFPVILPWPGFEDADSSPEIKDSDNDSSTTEQPSETESGMTEKPKQNPRSATEVPQSVPMPHTGAPPVMMQDPRLNNPRFNPNAPLLPMNQPWMFPPSQGNFDPRFPMQSGLQDPRLLQRFTPPRSDWAEMILIFPDGSFQHSIRDPRPMTMMPMPDGRAPNQRDGLLRPTLDFSQPQTQPMQTILAETENPEASNSRSRRAIASKTFKIPPAAGGLWTGENRTSEGEGRALLPPPKAVWGSSGTGNVPVRPIPPMYGVDNERCGVSSSSGINARVLSGRKPASDMESETSFAEFPWHVAVVNGQTGDYLCAGTIISARFIMTVAHCVRKFQFTLLFVRVGDWDLSGIGEMFPSYDVEVQNTIIHEEFYAGNLQNDIALLQLKFPLDFSIMPHVGTICLPPSSDPIYSDCIVTGWGQQLSTSEAKGDSSTFSRTLKQTSQTLVTAQFCEKALRPFLGQFYQLPKKGFVCAYDKDGKDSCFGDGGGALACLVNAPNYPKPMQYHVVGLVSWGVGCGMPNVPSAYTAIWDYLDWIRAKISPIDSYPMANPLPLKEPSPVIMVRANEAVTTTPAPSTAQHDFIDLAFA